MIYTIHWSSCQGTLLKFQTCIYIYLCIPSSPQANLDAWKALGNEVIIPLLNLIPLFCQFITHKWWTKTVITENVACIHYYPYICWKFLAADIILILSVWSEIECHLEGLDWWSHLLPKNIHTYGRNFYWRSLWPLVSSCRLFQMHCAFRCLHP